MDKWRTKGRIEMEPAGVFSRASLCKSSLEVAHAMTETKCSQMSPCADVDCILDNCDLGMTWVYSEGWCYRFPQRMRECGREECEEGTRGERSLYEEGTRGERNL